MRLSWIVLVLAALAACSLVVDPRHRFEGQPCSEAKQEDAAYMSGVCLNGYACNSGVCHLENSVLNLEPCDSPNLCEASSACVSEPTFLCSPRCERPFRPDPACANQYVCYPSAFTCPSDNDPIVCVEVLDRDVGPVCRSGECAQQSDCGPDELCFIPQDNANGFCLDGCDITKRPLGIECLEANTACHPVDPVNGDYRTTCLRRGERTQDEPCANDAPANTPANQLHLMRCAGTLVCVPDPSDTTSSATECRQVCFGNDTDGVCDAEHPRCVPVPDADFSVCLEP